MTRLHLLLLVEFALLMRVEFVLFVDDLDKEHFESQGNQRLNTVVT